jgi:hypothetical protein
MDAAGVLTLLSEPMRSANEAGDNDHAEPLLSFSDEVVGDPLAQLDRPAALTCITEQRYAVKVAARIVPEAVADSLKTGAVKGRRPAPAKGVIVTRANLECDAKAAGLADTAVSELLRRRHAQSCERPGRNRRAADNARIPEGLDEGAERLFSDIAGAAKRLEIEPPTPIRTEPPRAEAGAMDARKRLPCTQSEDWEIGQIARLL